jgi:predicted mannosyl-3-phosphoglycerate phosphatase (HAD superfamily)
LNDIRSRLESLADSCEYFVYFSDFDPSVEALFTNLRKDAELAVTFTEEFSVTPENLKKLFDLKALNRTAVEAAMSLHLTNR